MKKGQTGEGIITKVKFPNEGILITQDGEKVIVKNTVRGQKVRFSLKKKRKGRCEGRLLEVLEQSPQELPQPACVHFGECGGCTYQNLDYEKQLHFKEEQIKELLSEAVRTEDGAQDAWFEGIKPSPVSEGYRNKMEFSFGDACKDGPLALGMHKRGSFYDIVTVNGCVIADGDYGKILSAVLAYFTEHGTGYLKKNTHEGYLRHLLVRKAAKTGEILISLVTTTQSCGETPEEQLLEGFCSTLRGLELEGTIAGILHTKNDSLADAVINEGTDILYGQDYFYEELLGMTFKITAFSFFQTNSRGAEVLYETVREYIGSLEKGRESVVYDLYSGTGTIAQMMAPAAGKVIGVEIVPEAVQAARENAQRNGLSNCAFFAGDVLKVLAEDAIGEKPDLIILDPPREGVHPKALKKILDYGVERIVYVSCKPTSLVRDLAVMQESGYRVERGCCVDMFPGVYHVETIVLLSKGEVDSKKIRVEFSLEDMDMSEFQDGATYPQIKEYVLEHTGLKVSNLYISQIKRKCGIEVGKNYNLPKAEDSRQPQCPPEKEKAIREAFKYFGMI